jgi:hypothetical protein
MRANRVHREGGPDVRLISGVGDGRGVQMWSAGRLLVVAAIRGTHDGGTEQIPLSFSAPGRC